MLAVAKHTWIVLIASCPGKRHTKGEIKDWIRARYPGHVWA